MAHGTGSNGLAVVLAALGALGRLDQEHAAAHSKELGEPALLSAFALSELYPSSGTRGAPMDEPSNTSARVVRRPADAGRGARGLLHRRLLQRPQRPAVLAPLVEGGRHAGKEYDMDAAARAGAATLW